MTKPLSPYLDSLPACKEVLQYKHVLFDANVLISLLDDYTTDFLDFLESIHITFTIIHPVLVELLRTNNPVKRTQRQAALTKYKFTILPLIKNDMDNARDIQTWLSTIQCFPEPIDLYLGGILSRYHKSLLLATSNLSDFPFPLFERACYGLVQNDKHANIISFLSIDNSQLMLIQSRS